MNKLSPFRWFVLQNFPFIEADFDALTNYELMCKIVEYLNATIEKTNELGNQVEVLTNWFNNLDVQDEVDHKLDEMVEDGTLERIIGDFLNVTKNVKMYGAVGDGTTDDTDAIVSAIADLEDGESLYFPAGDYIVYSDYTPNTSNPSYPVEKLIRLLDKKRVCLFGDSKETTRIRPPYQGRHDSKVYFPCTITIQSCEDIEIKGLTIESKGENYGDHDSQSSIESGTTRATAMAANGGSAIFVAMSKNVEVHDCNCRLAGSCGTIYYTSFENANVHDCFVNVASLGYACVAFDNFVGRGQNFNEKGIVKDCIFHNETLLQPENNEVQIGSNTYAGKGGVYTEGSSNNTFYIDVIGCTIRDMYSGGTSTSGHRDGNGIHYYWTIGTISDNIIENCNVGIRNLQLNPDTSTGYPVTIKNNKIGARYTGIWMNHTGSDRASTKIEISNNIIEVYASSTVPDGAPDVLKQKGGISFSGSNSYQCTIANNDIKSAKGIYNGNLAGRYYILNNKLSTTDIALHLIGGGRFNVINNYVVLEGESNEGLYMHPSDGSSAGALYYNINDNTFYSNTEQKNVMRVVAGNFATYLHQESIKNNKYINCCCIHQRFTDPLVGFVRLKLNSKTLQGSNTLLQFDCSNYYVPYYKMSVINDSNNIVHATAINTYSDSDGTITLTFSGDIRSSFTTDNIYTLF